MIVNRTELDTSVMPFFVLDESGVSQRRMNHARAAGPAPIILCHVVLAERIGTGLHLD
jgi:hypothetical protein